MYNVKEIHKDLYYVGGSDHRLALFENVYPIDKGVSYNSYLFNGEKTVLMDTVDRSVSGVFFENIEFLLDGRPLDYVVVSHMEPDHSGTLKELLQRYPSVKIIANERTIRMINQFFTLDAEFYVVKDGESLAIGDKIFNFVFAPMVHWPEVMVTYESTTKALFSADAFGTFGALNGGIFADELNFERDFLPEARRYYTNIVGKYGTQVASLLRKALTLDIGIIAPLHGPVWRKNISWIIDKYAKWATYTPEEDAVVIAYSSVYGNTENAVYILAGELNERGVKNIAVYDVSVTHPSFIVSEAFRASHLVFAATTYNAGIFINMENLLNDLAEHNIQNRTVALLENGSWAPTSGGLMRDIFEKQKNITFVGDIVTISSSVSEQTRGEILELAKNITESFPKADVVDHSQKIEQNAIFKLTYGLFVLSAKTDKDNGCIINTVTQVTDNPKRIMIAVNKQNFTHNQILKTGVFNVSVLSNDAVFATFKNFGFQSGKDADKFDGIDVVRSENGLFYLNVGVNAFISAKVITQYDYGTHTVFIADVTEAVTLNSVPSMTYAYYFDHVKPKPQPIEEKKTGYICKICGYIHESDTLPADFICPLCKHGAEDFERL
ncbi:hypothetical protein FACS1894132_07180 [Clostridia bacterium]|nr:hypothetical protein FACS1894132_07180 [Clostridia bacterium]